MEPFDNFKYIRDLLQRFKNDKTIKIIECSQIDVGGKGNNYTSDVKRLTVKYQSNNCINVDHKINLIVKKMREDMPKHVKIPIRAMFENETNILSGPLKAINKLLGYQLAPNLLYSDLNDEYCGIVLEDLADSGFVATNRLVSLDLLHTIIVIRNFAKLHAASVAVCEQMPECQVKSFNRPFFHDPSYDNFVIKSITFLAQEIEQWPELGSKFAKKLMKLTETILNRALKVSTCQEDEFNVLAHGDCTQLNILFKYNQEIPTNCIFVDFQLSNYASPALDLLYFLSSSVTEDVYNHNQDILLKEYSCTLRETMLELKCKTKVADLMDLKKMMQEKMFFGLLSSCLIEPIIHVKPSDVASIDEMMSDDNEKNRKRFQREDFRALITKRLIDYDKMGLLEP